MFLRRLTSIALATFAALQLSSCACTLAGCINGVELTLVSGSGSFAAGTYTLSVTVSEESYGQPLEPGTCEIVFEFDGVYCDGAPCTMSDSACALHATLDGDELFIAMEESAPMMATVVLSRDDVELARESFAPVYEKNAPNGERCGPVCHYTAIQRTID